MKNRLNPQRIQKPQIIPIETAPSMDSMAVKLFVRSMLIYQEFLAARQSQDDSTLKIVYQGQDFPGALHHLTAPFAEHGVTLSEVRFRVCGPDRKHHQTEIRADGAAGVLCELAAAVNRAPVQFEYIVCDQSEATVTVTHPWIADVRAAFYMDEPGLLDHLAAITAEEVPSEPMPPPDWSQRVRISGSLMAVRARVLEVKALLRNDCDWAFGGIPGFQVDARIGAPTKAALEVIIQRWRAFCQEYGVMRSVLVDRGSDPEDFWQFDPKPLGNREEVPTQFLAKAA